MASPLALQAAGTAIPGTPIGAVLVQAGGAGLAIPSPLLSFSYVQGGASPLLKLVPFVSTGITGSTHGTNILDTLSVNPIAAGWLLGHTIWDDAGSIPPGTYIADIANDGTMVALSQPATRAVKGVVLNVQGTDLVTNWAQPIVPGPVVAQIQAQSKGYLTSTWEFIVTVTGSPLFAGQGGPVLTTDSGSPITP